MIMDLGLLPPSITRLDELRKMRCMVQELMLARSLLPPEECSWTAAALYQAFRNEDPGATRLVAHDMATDVRLVVYFATPRIGDKLNGDAMDTIIANFEKFIEEQPNASVLAPDIIVVSNDDVTAHVARRIAQWRQEWGADRPHFLLQTMKEAQLRYNPLRRLDGPSYYRAVPEADEEAVLKKARSEKGELPRFSALDSVVAFMGFLPGQLIEMEKKSETAGLMKTLRVVGRQDAPCVS